jgi:serine/threonine-protein kinase RsbW
MSTGQPPVHRLELSSRLASTPHSATVARHLLACALESCGVDDARAQDAVLVLHELVMNAVEHGAPDESGAIEVSWTLERGALCLTVSDHGRDGVVEVRPPTPDLPRGRGLAMVAALSQRWAVERAEHGTRVSAWLATR